MIKDWLIANFAIYIHLQYIFRRSSTFCVYLDYNTQFHRAFSLTDLTEVELRKLKILKRPVFIILI